MMASDKETIFALEFEFEDIFSELELAELESSRSFSMLWKMPFARVICSMLVNLENLFEH